MKWIIPIALCVMLAGCVAAGSRNLWYVRIGPQKLDAVKVIDPNGITVTIGGQEAEINAALTNALLTLATAGK